MAFSLPTRTSLCSRKSESMVGKSQGPIPLFDRLIRKLKRTNNIDMVVSPSGVAYVGTVGFDLDGMAKSKGWPYVYEHATDKENLGRIIAVDKVRIYFFWLVLCRILRLTMRYPRLACHSL